MSQPSVITPEHGPATPALIKWLKGIFGNAFSVSRGYSSGHDGIDLPAKEGTPIYALRGGVVSYARDARQQADRGLSGWAKYGGKVVNVDIGGGFATQYAHLQTIAVKEGQAISKGQLIGTVGRTGGSPDSPTAQFSGPHLHFGLWDKNRGQMVNPQKFLEGIGDTVGFDSDAALANLARIGIPTDNLNHVFTDAEIDRIARELYQVDPSLIRSKLQGKTVGDFISGGTNLEKDQGFLGIPGALEKVGTQLTDTFTWIGFIILGVVLIGGGIYLAKPTKDSE